MSVYKHGFSDASFLFRGGGSFEVRSALQGFHYERCCHSPPPPCKHDVPECAVTVAVGGDLFCAKHTFAEMGDMHTMAMNMDFKSSI
jgi:hypothetical protein